MMRKRSSSSSRRKRSKSRIPGVPVRMEDFPPVAMTTEPELLAEDAGMLP